MTGVVATQPGSAPQTQTHQPVVVQPAKGTPNVAGNTAAGIDDDDGLSFPCVTIVSGELAGRVPQRDFNLLRFEPTVVCSLGSAFVTIEAEFQAYMAGTGCVFHLPTKSSTCVTNVDIGIGDKTFQTEVVPNTDLAALQKGSDFAAGRRSYSPDDFKIAIGNVNAQDIVRVRVSYFEELFFEDGQYTFTLPCNVAYLSEIFNIQVTLNTGTYKSEWGEASHPLTALQESVGHIVLALDRSDPSAIVPKDFTISYTLCDNNILAAVLFEPAHVNRHYDPRDTFSVILTPPRLLENIFPRAVVFLIDRSGSMVGDPMNAAKSALSVGLDQLHPFDFFNIIAFDHEQAPFRTVLTPATEENITAAKDWVGLIQARGGTDIDTPLLQAVEIIEAAAPLPFIILITDGCVANERDVCAAVQVRAQRTRISTFGIGPFCNYYFLKMVATLGRGFSDRALRPRHIFPQMTRLLQRASAPVLTDISISVGELPGIEVYPFPVPDLFNGAPLIVSGKCAPLGPDNPSGFPSTITIQGKFPDGAIFSVTQNVEPATPMDLHSVFVKQNLDLLTARAWLTEDPQLKEQAILLSTNERMPCAYTTMICYQSSTQKVNKQKGKGRTGAALIAAASVGAVAVVGAALLGFGSLGGTAMNLPVMSAMDSLGGLPGMVGLDFDGGCCGCCGDGCGDAGGACEAVCDGLAGCSC